MWLLNTARAELKFFPTPESVPGGYAILSHAWDEHEQTFQDLQALCARCAANSTNPRDFVCDKIREFCVLAERGGHEWGWADMCCIDKTSSTDLSEAITSMYRYYSLAAVCYVYLRDVPTSSEGGLRASEFAFWNSRWHKRGWTLQELIAPLFVVFFSDTWEVLGSKADLAGLLEEITCVPVDVLKFHKKPSDYCIAERMSWAAERQTTRPEDEAYCLMGIFGIFMPPLYGEGRNAFLRLQEEIMRQVDDPSIFAWGGVGSLRVGAEGFITHALNLSDRAITQHEEDSDMPSENITLFAHSSSDFLHAPWYRIRPCTERPPSQKNLLQKLKFWTRPADLSKLPAFSITPYGVMAHVPVFSGAGSDPCLVVLLLGIELEVLGGSPLNLGLILRRVKSPDHTRPLYVPWHLDRLSGGRLTHLIGLGQDLTKTTLEWRTIYIVRGSTPTTDPPRLQMVSASIRAPFHIPQSEIKRLLEFGDSVSCSLHPENPSDPSWRRYVALKVHMSLDGYKTTVVIYLGLCGKASVDHPQHWARIVEYRHTEVEVPEGEIEHDCTKHHVDERPTQTHHVFEMLNLGWFLQLSFKPYPFSFMPCRMVAVRWTISSESYAG